MTETSEAAEGQRRERRGRGGDNRRRPSEGEGNEVATLHDPAITTPTPEAQDSPADAVAAAGDADNAQRAPRERRSRDRYGRDRRERAPRDGDTAESTAAATSVDAPPAFAPVAEADADRPTRSYFSQPVAVTEPVAPVIAEAAPAAPEPVQVEAARPAPAPVAAEPEPAVVRAPVETVAVPAPATGLPKVTPYTLSMDELNQVAQTSGLEWVNSNASKVAEVQAAIAAEPKPIHVPREPKPVVVADDGALVLVETRKDLSNMTLPFEGR